MRCSIPGTDGPGRYSIQTNRVKPRQKNLGDVPAAPERGQRLRRHRSSASVCKPGEAAKLKISWFFERFIDIDTLRRYRYVQHSLHPLVCGFYRSPPVPSNQCYAQKQSSAGTESHFFRRPLQGFVGWRAYLPQTRKLSESRRSATRPTECSVKLLNRQLNALKGVFDPVSGMTVFVHLIAGPI